MVAGGMGAVPPVETAVGELNSPDFPAPVAAPSHPPRATPAALPAGVTARTEWAAWVDALADSEFFVIFPMLG